MEEQTDASRTSNSLGYSRLRERKTPCQRRIGKPRNTAVNTRSLCERKTLPFGTPGCKYDSGPKAGTSWLPPNFAPFHHIVKAMELAQRLYARGGIPEVHVCNSQHLGTRGIVNHQDRF